MNLYLVGLRGTGKTTVGRLLAQRLGRPFFDADTELEAAAGRPIRDIFTTDGEAHFRQLEEATLANLASRGPAVIATGGGVVLSEANRRRLKETGRVVWLTADTATLWQRLQQDPATAGQRPNLGGGGLVELEETARRREPLYQSVADWIIPVAGRSPDEITLAILSACPNSFWTTVR
ncbi:MAG: shikimate kinase [Gemmataceae bacterium]